MCNERITGGLVAEREQPGLASTMWGTLNLDGAPHQIFAGIHHPGDKSVAQPKFESKPFLSKMCVCGCLCLRVCLCVCVIVFVSMCMC